MKGFYTVLLLFISNGFMTLAWYGHLHYNIDKVNWVRALGFFGIVVVSWSLAFFEYLFQVPANRIGFNEFGGPFNVVELKIIQEAVSLIVFSIFAILMFKEKFAWNYIVGFVFILLAVFFIFKKW